MQCLRIAFIAFIIIMINGDAYFFRYYLIVVFVGTKPSNRTTEFKSLENFELAQRRKYPYVAARLTEFPVDGFFTIGDGRTSAKESKRRRRSTNDYVNVPLQPNQDYAWFQRTCVTKVTCLVHCLKWLSTNPHQKEGKFPSLPRLSPHLGLLWIYCLVTSLNGAYSRALINGSLSRKS